MERREEREEGAERKTDMLAALIAADDGFSNEEIVDFFVAILVDAYETTPTIMCLAVKFLTETPLALAQLKVFSMFSIPSISQRVSLRIYVSMSCMFVRVFQKIIKALLQKKKDI